MTGIAGGLDDAGVEVEDRVLQTPAIAAAAIKIKASAFASTAGRRLPNHEREKGKVAEGMEGAR
jgi:hypothetical protein